MIMDDFKLLLEKAKKEKLKKHDCVLFQMLTKASCEFLRENFDGAFEIEESLVGCNTADISLDGYASFLRRLFDIIFGRSLIKIRFFEENESLFINFSWKNADISERDEEELSYVAKRSGFSFDFIAGDETNTISVKIEKAALCVYPVYATDDDRIKPRLLYAFKDFLNITADTLPRRF